MKQQVTTTRAFGFAARCLFAFFLLFTSFYSVLAYVPETYIAFIQAPFLSWVPMLIRIHPYVYTVLAAAVSLALWMERGDDRVGRRMVLEFIGAALLVSIYLFLVRPFSGLRNDSHSFVLGAAAIFPILWIGAIDCRTYWRKRDWAVESAPFFSISLLSLAALAISIVYPLAAYLRYQFGGMPLRSVQRRHGITPGNAARRAAQIQRSTASRRKRVACNCPGYSGICCACNHRGDRLELGPGEDVGAGILDSHVVQSSLGNASPKTSSATDCRNVIACSCLWRLHARIPVASFGIAKIKHQ
jgi:hypothetical protein